MTTTKVSLPELQEIGSLGDALELASCLGYWQRQAWNDTDDRDDPLVQRYVDSIDAILVAMAVDIKWVLEGGEDERWRDRWLRSISRHYKKLWAKYCDAYNIERRKRS